MAENIDKLKKRLKGKKHLFFDMDNTLTRSRTPIEPGFRDLLEALPQTITVVTGQFVENIFNQTEGLTCYAMGQNGNRAYDPKRNLLWEDRLSNHEVAEVLEHIAALLREKEFEVKDPNDLIEHRTCQLCYSLIGHHEDIEKKEACDPDKTLRLELLKKVPFESETLEVKIGGTTTFDYFKKGRHKGYNVARLIEHNGWKREDSVYIGDGLFPGGNDEAVIGVIETIPVNDYKETMKLIEDVFSR